MEATRTLTVFAITDPDEPEHHHKNLLCIALRHPELTQTEVEIRLRDVARQFGVRWAGMGKLFQENAERVILELKQHDIEFVLDQPFFTVNGAGMVRREHKPEGLLEHMAVAATEPTIEEHMAELLEFVREELDLDEDEATEALDSAVHDCKSGEAASINNGGVESQIEFLCEGMTLEEAKDYLRSEVGQEEEEEEEEEEEDEEEDDEEPPARVTGTGRVRSVELSDGGLIESEKDGTVRRRDKDGNMQDVAHLGGEGWQNLADYLNLTPDDFGRAIDFTERRTGNVHEESMVGGQAFCAVCGVVTKDSDPYFHGDSFLDIPILELTIEEEPDDEVSLCALVSKKLGVELTLEDATKYLAAAFDRE